MIFDNSLQTKEERRKQRFFRLRQILNTVFIIGAIVGVAMYYFSDVPQTGIIVVLCSMLFKIVECVFRFIK